MNHESYIPNFKKTLVVNILDFFSSELHLDELSPQAKERLSVAMRLIGESFSINMNDFRRTNRIDLLELFCSAEQSVIDRNNQQLAEYHNNLGNRAMRSYRFAEAIYEYTMAIQLNARNPVYFCNRGEAYTYTLSLTIAYQDCEEAIKLNPQYARAHNRFGIVLMNLRKYSEACTAFQNALKFQPNHYYSFNLLCARQKLAETITPPPGFSYLQASPVNYPMPTNPFKLWYEGPYGLVPVNPYAAQAYLGFKNDDLDPCGPRLYIHDFSLDR